jgi:hypothetical protein
MHIQTNEPIQALQVLTIGNSFSEDAARYLHGIAEADGVGLEVTNLFIGGCSLERHCRNMQTDERAYVLQQNGRDTGICVSLRETLQGRQWDVVTIQQVSHLSFNRESYLPYVMDLAKFVRECVPQARLYLHQTWAYEEGSERLFHVAGYGCAADMLRDVVRVNAEIAHLIGADGVIPSGELFGALSRRGIAGLHRDTFHASLGLGRYALGTLWYRVLTSRPVSGNSFHDLDEAVSADEMREIRETVDAL